MLRKVIVGGLIACTTTLGLTAVTAPAWAATCSLGANLPTAITIDGKAAASGLGSRTGCTDTVTYLEVRLAKDVFGVDPYVYHHKTAVKNDSFAAKAKCTEMGSGNYYTWTVSSTGNQIESGRVARC